MDSPLSVIISSPTHTPHKFTLDLSRQCSILELKEIIVTRLDTKLTIADQRLIFGGRILDDKDTLDRVFEKIDCSSISPTIHLVVSHRHDTGQTQQQQQQQQTTTPTSSAPLRFRGNSDNTPSTAPTNNTAATSGTNLNGFAFTPFTTATPAATTTGARDGRTETDASSNATNPTTAYNPFPFTIMAGGVPMMVPMAPQAMQYVLVNGMPYLAPTVYLPILHYQQMQQTYGQVQFLPDGTPFLPSLQNINNNNINNPIADQARAGAAVAADTPQQNAQEIAARDQRRAASLWLLMKLAFGIYLFGQNGSIERLVLLHIAALVIFLHQTGRLRIVRRIVQNPPAEDAAQGAANPVPGAAAAPQPTQTTTSTSTTTTTSTSTSTSSSTDNNASTANTSSNSTSSNIQNATMSTSENSTTQQQQPHGGDAQAQETVATTTEAVQPRVSPWRSLEHALLTFVTSLVPAPQPDIDPAVAAAAAAGDRGM
ncbi:hypothetical protein BG015_001803 [Linnemannia schmuckeri]|uniref:Ubiquitin-like domain-containing protein n=1 Tax=Linnemannia schmuckeri TaxID=64567 RepID=A0A9P5RPS4_9FUNG|nr:hypothetical protein BG015_001803 [Linnemannia schmuckeri]